MAPPREASEPGRLHSIFVRLTPAVFQRIASKAKAEGRPLNCIIMDELTAYPQLAGQVQFGKLLAAMETVLARYSARIIQADLETQLLKAVDLALAATTDGERQARLDGMRVLRNAMLGRAVVDPSEITPLDEAHTHGEAVIGEPKREAAPRPGEPRRTKVAAE